MEPAAAHASRIGTVIGERYRIEALIGHGGMGVVFRAEHIFMKKTVALKILHPEMGRIDEVAKRFEREAQSASKLSHPNIVDVTDFGRTSDGVLFLVMEYLEGVSLTSVLRGGQRLPSGRALAILRQILAALEHAHSKGVVHRDLKPDNIMLVKGDGDGEQVKLLDFGIAKMGLADAGETRPDAPVADGSAQTLTQGGVVFGTPHYMSPEQALGQETTARTDLYSAGVIAYEMLTGRKPFESPSLVQVISMHLTADPASLRSVAPEAKISRALERVVLHALVKTAGERVTSAAEFVRALSAAERAGADGTVGRLRDLSGAVGGVIARVGRRKRIAAAGLVLVAVAVAVAWLARNGRPKAPNDGPLKLAEEALRRGELPRAKAILQQELSAHPKTARAHYLLGNIAFLERDREAGLEAYRETLRLDDRYRREATILHNVRPLLEDRRLGEQALGLLIDGIGEPSGTILAGIASNDHRAEFRRRAREACDHLGCDDDVDHVQSWQLDLSQAKQCEERREAMRKLAGVDDRRVLEILRKERRRGHGFFGLFGDDNACMKEELEQAIADHEND